MIGYLAQPHPLVQALVPVATRRPRRAAAAARGGGAAPRLSDFLPEEEISAVRGTLDRPVAGLAVDWRRVVPGSVFFELPGAVRSGAPGCDEAVSRGAVAVVRAVLPAVSPGGVTAVQVADVPAALARAAQRFYRFPDRSVGVVGVAGEHGKTTVAHLLKHLLNGDQRVGLLGSVHYELGQRTVPSLGDTPEALENFGLLAQMRDAGCRHAVVEVSARALAARRVDGMQWAAVVFTGGAAPGGEAAYPESCFMGSHGRPPPVAVINTTRAGDREWARRLAAAGGAARVVTYGGDPAAQVRAEGMVMRSGGTSFRLVWPGGTLPVESPLTGRGNVGHLLAAVAAAWGLGRDPQVVLARLRALGGVPGRLERIEEGQDFSVWVDASDSPARLGHALRELREVTPGRLLVVFGDDGRRERAARPELTRAAEAGADVVIATAANPRSEPQEQIFADLRAGAGAPERIAWIPDRRRAIALAVALARPGDGVVITGRGHQAYQQLGDTVAPCDDRQVVRAALRGGRP